mmetsp:Transcript_5109/g.10524  ORF Transcript_5109/g.10524 Transcript_5109/m.10524 type:complete len:92 (-) Transcript_5109:38-313(-)
MQSTAMERLRVIESERIDSIRFDSTVSVKRARLENEGRWEGTNRTKNQTAAGIALETNGTGRIRWSRVRSATVFEQRTNTSIVMACDAYRN